MDCGINCLIREYENVQKISTDILIDIFFNIDVIRFLFSGLVFSIAQNSREVPLVAFSHRQGFTTATTRSSAVTSSCCDRRFSPSSLAPASSRTTRRSASSSPR